MNRMLRWSRMVLLLTAVTLVAAACRGAGEQAADDETEPAAPAVTTPADAGTGTAPEPADTETPTDPANTGQADVTTDVGVSEEPCPDAVNPDNGCIYLAVISDFTGTFAGLGVPIAEAVAAFWQRVNEDGGIGGYDIDATRYVRDNNYNPETHNQVYQEIKGDVLALAMSLGSPTTAAIYDDLEANSIVTVPAGWTSNYVFQDVIIESGTSYCIESMNAIDWATREVGDVQTVMAVYYPGDYGADAAVGARYASEELGLEFTAVETVPGQENQAGAVDAIASQQPDLVIISTGPTDLATIVGQAAARGYQGRYIGTSPTWNPGLIETPAGQALAAQYYQSAPWASYEADTPGHQAMREMLGEQGNDGLTSGWVWQYPMRAALEAAVENGDLTREGLLEAATSLESVDYEGMLPEGSGNFAAGEAFPRVNLVQAPSEETGSGVEQVTDFFSSEVAEGFQMDSPCHTQL